MKRQTTQPHRTHRREKFKSQTIGRRNPVFLQACKYSSHVHVSESRLNTEAKQTLLKFFPVIATKKTCLFLCDLDRNV